MDMYRSTVARPRRASDPPKTFSEPIVKTLMREMSDAEWLETVSRSLVRETRDIF